MQCTGQPLNRVAMLTRYIQNPMFKKIVILSSKVGKHCNVTQLFECGIFPLYNLMFETQFLKHEATNKFLISWDYLSYTLKSLRVIIA